VASHDSECLQRRYCELSFEAREYWPDGFSSRDDLCTGQQNPKAEAKKPEHDLHRQALEDWLGALA
jgi:hypothetical protein